MVGRYYKPFKSRVSRLSYLQALAYMHALRMQHRDLKPDNIMFDTDSNARIIDLGLASIVVAKSRVSSGNGSVGAELYRSPEKAMGQRYDAKDDIWALGCILAGDVTGKSLEVRSGDSGSGLIALDTGAIKRLVDESVAASSRFGELVGAMLRRQALDRPTADRLQKALANGNALSSGPEGAMVIEEEEEEDAADADADARRAAGGDFKAAEAAALRGDFRPLVVLLRRGDAAGKLNAAGALWSLADNANNKILIARAGAVGPLVKLLRSGDAGGKEKAAGALWNPVLRKTTGSTLPFYTQNR